jgi:hypothetical protein
LSDFVLELLGVLPVDVGFDSLAFDSLGFDSAGFVSLDLVSLFDSDDALLDGFDSPPRCAFLP